MGGVLASDFLRGHTDAIILSLLSLKDSYGYEIFKAIIEITGEQFKLKEATLYASFKRLEHDGFVTSYWGDETKGGRRKYYVITDTGRNRLEQSKKEWKYMVNIINSLLGWSFPKPETADL